MRITTLLMSLGLLAGQAAADDLDAQLARGESLYSTHCAGCHSMSLRGSAHGAALKGTAFFDKWENRDSTSLVRYNQANMPPGSSHSLSEQQHVAIVAFLLDRNGLALPGPLGAETRLSLATGKPLDIKPGEAMESWASADTIDEAARSRSGFVNRRLAEFRPVTEAMLADPPDGDWLSWRCTRDGQGYSPLRQVNRDNVDQLELAWVLAMADGSNQVTPLVHDGVMYLTHPGNVVQAVAADTGEVIWEYRNAFPAEARTLGGPVRNIAIYGDKLFLATYDAAIVAIDARSGEEVWKTPKADYRQAYTHTAGPIVGGGVVLSGINGCELFTAGGCFITGP